MIIKSRRMYTAIITILCTYAARVFKNNNKMLSKYLPRMLFTFEYSCVLIRFILDDEIRKTNLI